MQDTNVITGLDRLNYLLKLSARHPKQESCWLYSFERCGSDGDACLFNGPFICRQNYDFWNRFHHESGWIGEEKDSHYMISNWVAGLIVSRSKAVEAAFHHLKGKLSRARVLVCGKKKKRKSSGRKKKYKRADELSADSTSPNSANTLKIVDSAFGCDGSFRDFMLPISFRSHSVAQGTTGELRHV